MSIVREVSIEVALKPSSAVCPWCDEEVLAAYVHGEPRIIQPCQHSKGISTSTRPLKVVFCNTEVGHEHQ